MPADTDLQKAIGQFSDWKWRLSNLYFITDKDGKRVQFQLNWAQERLFNEMHYQNVILKARQLGFCLDPATRVLTADLRWVPIADLQPGQQVVAIDEHIPGGRGAGRKMRTATIQGVCEVYRQAYRITFDDGRAVICTGQHPWLSKKTNTEASWRSIEASTKKKLTPGTKVRWITKPWGQSTVEDGWFGGMLDGEGSLSNGNATGSSVCVAQRAGPVWNRLLRYGQSRGYNYCIESDRAERPSKFGKVPVPKFVIGRMDEIFRVLGQTRPTRFIGKHFWEGRDLPGKRSGLGWATITAIEPLGERLMIDLQTSTGTYIAEGFVSHNTTFIQVFMLDACVWNSNLRAGTIAHTLNDAQAIFRDKVKFPYENLPEAIRAVVHPTTELMLSNNSLIRVATSHRSGTLNYLHISEYGKVCAKFPEKAREIRTGALNTVQSGQVVFIESTAEGQEGHFFSVCEEAQAQARRATKLTPLDFKFHFYPWWQAPEYRLDPEGVEISDAMARYFTKLKESNGIVLDAAQKAWYVKKAATQLGDMKREFPATSREAFEASVEGAYYGELMEAAETAGRIGAFKAVPGVPVHTTWDIGHSDYTSIWFWQRLFKKVRLVGYYQNAGEGAPHYAEEVQRLYQANGWLRNRESLDIFPHDARVTEWGSDKSRIEQLIALGFRPTIATDMSIDDGINAVRAMLPICEFDAELCSEGIKALKSYRKEWNEELGRWRDKPFHNWASDGADSARYLAIMQREAKIIRPEDKATPKQDLTYAVDPTTGMVTGNMSISDMIKQLERKAKRR